MYTLFLEIIFPGCVCMTAPGIGVNKTLCDNIGSVWLAKCLQYIDMAVLHIRPSSRKWLKGGQNKV